jgi:hypothetical protein
LTLAEGQAVTDFVIEVTPPPVVSGHLLAPDGTPLAGREVELRGYTIWDFLHGWNWDQDWDWDKVTQLTLDGNGGFTLYPPATGTAHILIRLADIGYVLQTLEIQGGEDITNLEWRLKPFKAVVGQVREKRTGEPLAGVQVWLEPRGVFRFDLSFQATSRADGRFELQGLVEGEYQVSLSKPGYRYSGERRIQVAEDTLPDELHLDLELEEENWVGEGMNLSVLDDYGQGMPRAWWPLKKRFQSGSLLGSTDSPPQPEK